MSDLLAALGGWIDSRVKHRGFWYKLGVAALFVVVIGYFIRDIFEAVGGME